MPSKRIAEEEEEWPRRKAPMFNDIEAKRLISLYCENRDRYHGKFKPGTKSGESDKQILLKEWSKEISSMGFANRTKTQIEEKIRNEVKKVQKHLRAQKERRSGAKGGAGPRLPRLASYLEPLAKLLDGKQDERVVPEIEEEMPSRLVVDLIEVDSSDYGCALFEEDRKPTQRELRSKLAENFTPAKYGASFSKQRPTGSPEIAVNDEGRAAMETATSEAVSFETLSLFTNQRSALLEEEMKLAKLKQEEVAIRLEEAKVLLELRRVELVRAKLELERLRAAPAERDSPAPTPPSSANSNSNCYNV